MKPKTHLMLVVERWYRDLAVLPKIFIILICVLDQQSSVINAPLFLYLHLIAISIQRGRSYNSVHVVSVKIATNQGELYLHFDSFLYYLVPYY